MERETIMVGEPQGIAAIGGSKNASSDGAIFDIRENIGFLLGRAYRYVTWGAAKSSLQTESPPLSSSS
jgi:hypothetical protein